MLNLSETFDLVKSRLDQGRPFSTPRNAWMGYEQLTEIDGWYIGITVASGQIMLQANTKTLLQPRLPIASHNPDTGLTIILDRARFDRWAGQFTQAVEPVIEPVATDPVDEAAQSLLQFHNSRAFKDRLARAIELVRCGEFNPGKYGTHIDEATGVSYCQCPDAEHGAPHANSDNKLGILTYHNGVCCKHALAQRINYIVRHTRDEVAYREHFEKVERRTGHTYDTVPGDGGCSDQDLVAPLPAQTWRMNLQTALVAKDHDRANEMLATMRADLPRLNGKAGEYQKVIDWAEKWLMRDRSYDAALRSDRLNTRGRQRNFQHTGHNYR